MSDFVKNLTDTQAQHAADLAELKQTVAELKHFLADLIAPPPAPEPAKVDSRLASCWRRRSH